MRITKKLVADMQNNALRISGVTAAESALVKRRYELAEAVRVYSLGGAEGVAKVDAAIVSINEILGSLPNMVKKAADTLFSYQQSVRVSFGGQYDNIYLNEDCAYKICYGWTVDIDTDHPLTAEWRSIIDAGKELGDKRQDVRNAVAANAKQFTTVKAMLEAWPEAAELLPKETQAVKANLPAIPVAQINAIIGLPSSTDTAKA